MQDLVNEENFPLDPESPANDERTGPTGPNTPDGKAKSSLNSLKHGCCSEKTLLCHEDPAEFEFTVNWWFEHYQPEDNVAITLVQETARAHWFFKRNSKRLEEVEGKLPTLPYCWTDDNHRQFTNFTRYKTTTERAFYRAFKELEAYYGRLGRAEHLKQRARNAFGKLQMQWFNQHEKGTAEDLKLTQVIEVEVIEGKCKTTYYPGNQQLIKEAAGRPKPPVLVQRFVCFSNGVPSEYAWATPNEVQKLTDSQGVQKMPYDWWLQLIEREKIADTGHIGPMFHLEPTQ